MPTLKKQAEAFFYQKALDGYAKSLPDIFLTRDEGIEKDSTEFKTYLHIINSYVGILRKIQQDDILAGKIQERRLKRILGKAMETAWWPKYFKELDIDVSTIRSLTDLKRITPVTRYNFIDVPKEDLLTVPKEDSAVIWRGSSGSTTGTPFIWGLNKTLLIVDVLGNFIKQLEDRGFSFKENSGENFHVHLNMFMDSARHAFKWFSIKDVSMRRHEEGFNEKVYEFAKSLESIPDPVVLTAPADILSAVEAFKERDLHPRISFFLTVGSPLYENQRRAAAEYFKCQVFSFYGAQEMGPCAIECKDRHGLYHTFSDRVILEVADEKGAALPPGVEGLITVTCLDNTVMPLIRYQPGDIAISHEKGSCGCGNTSGLFEIRARVTDVIHFSDGKTTSINPILRSFSRPDYVSQVRKFQVRQDELDKIVILIEAKIPLSGEAIEKLHERIKLLYGERLTAEINQVAIIPNDGPKFKVFVPLKRSKNIKD
jgi:phenylacetate-coenzyme A ligase PaaK-like adenylate-forming protein